MPVRLVLQGKQIEVDQEVFSALFENSVVSGYAGVVETLNGRPLNFAEFIKLARQAEIPYPLFFAPLDVVEAQLRLKRDKLMVGFTKTSFSMQSRHRVELRDVELIVKDILRKQAILRKYDRNLVENEIIGCLRGSKRSVELDARALTRKVGFSREDIRSARTKEAAIELFIDRLESKQVFVSRSAQHYMPQEMPKHAKFSGLTIKDKKVPFIFLATGNEGEDLEPAGRRLFTLTLLTVLIARGTFTAVNYDGHTKEENSSREYQVTCEILMPAGEFGNMVFSDLEAVKNAADAFRVTPSAVAMHARRLGIIGRDRFEGYMDRLETEYRSREKPRLSSPLAVNALKKYNGLELSRRMLAILDAGELSHADFRRIMFSNKIPFSQVSDFRQAVR